MILSRLAIAAVVLLVIAWMTTFIITEREQALVLYLGKIHRSDYKPGLHFKMPLLMQVKKFDLRLLSLDGESQRFLTQEKKDVIVDSYARWRITDPVRYYNSTKGDETRAAERLSQIINSELREEFGKRTIADVVSGDRGEIMGLVTASADKDAKALGLDVVDVRIKQIDLPPEVSESVYGRMRAERERAARDLRSRGAEAGERIRADADRQRTVLLAEAYRDAETTRGQGDARAAEVYSAAYGIDPEFYSFYRSLNAYRTGLNNEDDILVLQPDSKFFQYFISPERPAQEGQESPPPQPQP